jgi:alpha-mannosidase
MRPMTPEVDAALARLRAAADTVRAGWLPEVWHTMEGDVPTDVAMRAKVLQDLPYGVFPELVLLPDAKVALRCPLDVPPEVAGVTTVGEPLELTVNSLYPITVRVDDVAVLDADGVPAAAGPALVEVLPAVREGGSGTLVLEIRTPPNAVHNIGADLIPPWVWLHFTTPSLRARFEVLDLAWARLHLADHFASCAEDRARVEEAARALPDDLIAATTQELGVVTSLVADIAERAATVDLHLVGHSHIDLAWLWTWADTRHVVVRDFVAVLAMLDDYPELCFTHSQPATYEVVREERPDLFERVRAHVASGRWEPATAQWVESDMNLPSGEALTRQLLEGVAWTREHFDRSPDVLLAPDTFGFAGNVPQLAASAGVTALYHHRCVPGSPPWPAYWWEGDDGTRILGISTPSYHGQISAGRVAVAAASAHRAGHATALMVFGIGDHGGGPTRQSLDVLRRLQHEPGLPTLRCSTVGAYRDALLAEQPELPVHRGESSFTFPGCYTSHADGKAMNRRVEAALVMADTLSVIGGIDRAPEMGEAWRTALFQQFHDILGGSSIPDVYLDQAEATGHAMRTADSVAAEALAVLHPDAAEGAVTVTNPHGWPRADVVDLGGQRVVAHVPPFASVTFESPHVVPSLPSPEIDVTPDTIVVTSTRRTTVLDRASGTIVSMLDAATGIDLLGGAGDALNVLELVEEEPIGMSAWRLGSTRSEERLVGGAHSEVIEAGPARVVIEVVRRVRDSDVRQHITLYDDVRIDVDTWLDWRERGGADVGIPGLKLGCVVALDDRVAWFETPFAAASRPIGPDEVPALGWGAVEDAHGRGIALLSDSRHAYDTEAGRLRLRLVRSAYEPDPTADLTRHHVKVTFVPLTSGWRAGQLPQRAAGLLTPLVCADGVRGATTWLGWAPQIVADPAVVVAGMKPARSGAGVIVRAYESTGRPGRLRIGNLPAPSRLHRVTVVEDIVSEVDVEDGRATVALRAFEVVTLLVAPR